MQNGVNNKVLLAENVIMGKIPTNYYNLEGLNRTDAIEMVE